MLIVIGANLSFVFVWFFRIGKSNLARNFAEYELVEKIKRSRERPFVRKIDDDISQQLPLLLERDRASIVPEAQQGLDASVSYLIDLTSAYIARNRFRSLGRAVEEDLVDATAMRIIDNIDEEQFRALMAIRLEGDVLAWLSESGVIAGFFYRVLHTPILSSIVERYVGNFVEIKEKRREMVGS
ncbi:hypothetical protein ACQR0Y_29165 [Bradyrhizobium oligotrophicum]